MTTAQNASHYSIIALRIISSSGAQQSLDFLREELNLYQDIYSNTMSGDLQIKDTQNIISAMGLCGNEFLQIEYTTYDYTPFRKIFRIYKISEIKFANATTLRYKIHFCSEEFILNQQMRISKSYNGLRCSEIVNDIATNFLKIPVSNFTYEQTSSIQKLIIPNQKPLEAINWISSFSINETLNPAYVFFETQTGFKFFTLQRLFSAKVARKLSLNPQNILDESADMMANKSTINKIEIDQAFDVLSTLSSGGYSSYMLKLDLTHGKYDSVFFNPINAKLKTLNESLPVNMAANRNDVSLFNGSGYERYFTNFQGDLAEKWLLQRAAHFALINNNRMKVSIYGDSMIEAGMIVDIDFPTIAPSNNSKEIFQDKFKSGKYLVTSVRNRIYENRYTTYLELCKDSNLSGIPAYVNTEAYNTAKKS